MSAFNKTVNEITLIGYVGIEPKLNKLHDEKYVGNMSLATHNIVRRENELTTVAVWHRLVLWDKLAVTASSILKKGAFIYVKGSLRYRQYEDGMGNHNSVTEILVDSFKLLDKKIENKYPSPNDNNEAPIFDEENTGLTSNQELTFDV